ncbi:MAG: TetR/AcrR family transcriptional regulator [Oscillospiraceae bacterium]|nr:TetR/AcrR family transcriptional regulator [Oscillospiraceae bacterium]
MESQTTKEKIVREALRLFSQNGFDAVSVEQIAAAVGIKAPSLYKHYKSKWAIFDAIFDEMQRRYDEETKSMNLHLSNAATDRQMFAEMTVDKLVEQVKALVSYSLHDELVSRFRRLMTIEQFRSEGLAALYTERYVMRMLEYHEALFRGMIQAGVLRGGDPRSMAWQYVSPILIFLSLCDRQPEKEAEVLDEIEKHIRQFHKIYKEENKK